MTAVQTDPGMAWWRRICDRLLTGDQRRLSHILPYHGCAKQQRGILLYMEAFYVFYGRLHTCTFEHWYSHNFSIINEFYY